MNPKVTVIIPLYNHAKFVAEAIQSALEQTYQNIELIIVDDCSTDNSVDIIKTFVDNRITILVNEINIGASATVNKIINMAKGEYIALLNSDDIWMPDKLEKQLAFLENNLKYVAVFSYAEIIDEDGVVFKDKAHFYSKVFIQQNRARHEWLNYFFYNGNCLCHPSILIRKSVYFEVGLYNTLLASLPDFEMWVRILIHGYEIHIMDEKMVKFRILNNEQNASGNNIANKLRGAFEQHKIWDQFSNISSIGLFNKVFPENIIDDIKQVPMQLVKTLLKSEKTTAQNWAINRLYDLLSKEAEYYSDFILTNEFIHLTSTHDVFNQIKLESTKLELESTKLELESTKSELLAVHSTYSWRILSKIINIYHRIYMKLKFTSDLTK